MPRVINPPNHFLNSSNNLIVSYDYAHYVAPAGNPTRAQRVMQMLTDQPRFTVADFAQMQADSFCTPGARMAQRVRSVQPRTELGCQARDLLVSWDGNHRPESSAGAVYETMLWKLFEATLGRIRDWMPDPKLSDEALRPFMGAVLGMIETNDRELLAHESFPFESWDVPLAEALDSAADHLQQVLGGDPAKWTWGALHYANFRHGIGREEPAASLLNVGRFPVGGSGETVNNTAHGGGPAFRAINIATYRQIIDLADVNNSLFIIPPGNSGHVASPHYADHLEDYLAVRYRPLLWEWSRIEAEAESEQTLTPKPTDPDPDSSS